MKIKSNSVILLILSIFLQSFSFLSIKISTLNKGMTIYLFMFLAFVFMGLRAIVWQILLKYSDLSLVYPFASFVQVLILIYAIAFFNESLSLSNIIGLMIMLGGIYLLTAKKKTL